MCNHLHTIPACDRRQTDRRIFCHGIVRAMHTRRAVMKTETDDEINVHHLSVTFVTRTEYLVKKKK